MTKRNLIWAVVLLAAAVILVWVRKPALPPPREDGLQPPLRPLIETYRLIEEKGYRPSTDDALVRGAVGGMAAAADEYATYVPPEKVEAFRRRMEGVDQGVGLRLEQAGEQIRVFQAVFGSPAFHAGLGVGEVVLAIDGQAVGGMSAAQAERLINDGRPGSSVRLEILSPDDHVRTVTLTRQEFRVESVRGLWRGDDDRWNYLLSRRPPIACVRVREFVRHTAEEVQIAIRQVDTLQGLVLDLRDNPGGQLPAAVDVADLFLREGPIVVLVDKSGKGRPFVAHSEGTYPEDLRLVVLINGQTASAAEIVAGALAENRRAVLIGTRTKGKGYIQGMFQLSAGMGEMNLTNAEFLLGQGRSIQRKEGSDHWGVDPHLKVAMSPLDAYRLSRLLYRLEAVPPVHAAPATGGADSRSIATEPSGASIALAPAAPAEALLALDEPLRKAVALLTAPQEFDAVLRPPPPSSAPAGDKAR
jgi:carboxyl-terminal processing protease